MISERVILFPSFQKSLFITNKQFSKQHDNVSQVPPAPKRAAPLNSRC